MSRRNRLRHFIRDGFWATLCEGFAESNFVAFLTKHSTPASALGALSSSQSLMACWLQLWSERLVRVAGSRKRLVLACVGAQCLLLGGMTALAYLGSSVWLFMAACLAFSSVGGLSGAVWSSWVSELLPSRRRGFCLAARNQRTQPANFVAVLAGGWVLQRIASLGEGAPRSIELGFVAVFSVGLVAKCLSLRHLSHQPELRAVHPQSAQGPLSILRSAIADPVLRRMTLLFASMGFAVNMSGPFHTPFLLATLKLSFMNVSIIGAAHMASRFFLSPLVGGLVDRIGSRALLAISCLLLPMIPLGWAAFPGFVGILCVQIFGGFAWSAFDLCAFSYLTESTRPANRQRAFALRAVAGGLSAAAGAAVGGAIVHSFGEIAVFVTSGAFRILAALVAVWALGWLARPKASKKSELAA